MGCRVPPCYQGMDVFGGPFLQDCEDVPRRIPEPPVEDKIGYRPVSHSFQVSLLPPANPVHQGKIMFELMHHPFSIFSGEVQGVFRRDAIDGAIRCFGNTAWKGVLNLHSTVSLQECMFQALDIAVFRFKNWCT